MRSFETVNEMYTVFVLSRDPAQAAQAAARVWDDGLKGFPIDRREAKKAKMLDVAAREPHPAFAAFVRSIARGSGGVPNVDPQGGVHKPPPLAVLPNETPPQTWERMCDAQGKVIDGICAALLAAGEPKYVVARVRYRLADEMKAAKVQDGLRAVMEDLRRRGVTMEALFKTLDWLAPVDVQMHANIIVQDLDDLCAQFVAAKQSGEALPAIEPRLLPELKQARSALLLLRVFFPGALEAMDVYPDLQDYLAAALFHRLPELMRDLTAVCRARRLPALLQDFKARRDAAIRALPADKELQQQALSWCLIMEQLTPWQERWLPRAEAIASEEAVARCDRRLRKNPRDVELLLTRAKLYAERLNKPQAALADLDAALALKDDAEVRLQRAVLYAGFGRLGDARADVEAGLAGKQNETPREVRAKLYTLRADLRLRGEGSGFDAWCDTVKAALLDPGNGTALELMRQAEGRVPWVDMATDAETSRELFAAYVALQRQDFAAAAAGARTAAEGPGGTAPLRACARGLEEIAALVAEVGELPAVEEEDGMDSIGLLQLLSQLQMRPGGVDAGLAPIPEGDEPEGEAAASSRA